MGDVSYPSYVGLQSMTVYTTLLYNLYKESSPYILLNSGEKMKKWNFLYVYLHFYIIPILSAYFLACYPYIFLHFLRFSFLYTSKLT